MYFLNDRKLRLANDDNARVIAMDILEIIYKISDSAQRTPVFLCIGSDYYIGDALGPLVGSTLVSSTHAKVWGTLEMPVCANNLEETIFVIRSQWEDPLIICVDAGIGRQHEVGCVEVRAGGLQAGIGIGQRLPAIGDVSIIGVVNRANGLSFANISNVSLKLVMTMSQCIANALTIVIATLNEEKNKREAVS